MYEAITMNEAWWLSSGMNIDSCGYRTLFKEKYMWLMEGGGGFWSKNVISVKYNHAQANDIRSRDALCTPSLNVDIF
jgi:hypothetical protein